MGKQLNVIRLTALLSVSILLPMASSAGSISEEIKGILDLASSAEIPVTKVHSLDADILVPRFYEQRGFSPAWSEPNAVEDLFRALDLGVQQGFRASDFDIADFQGLLEDARKGGDQEEAIFDVRATDTAVKLIHHLVFGKVDPETLDEDWNFSKPIIQQDPATVLNTYLDGDGIGALIDEIDIKNTQYKMLVGALADYRAIAEQGGWPIVPDETVLKPGMIDPAVADLRRRLAVEQALTPRSTEQPAQTTQNADWTYDARLEEDVRAFQSRHGLQADGVIGARTFASLNKPVEDRINKLRLSLERGRWLMRELDEEFVLVNIAGARTYLVKADGTLWTTRSITGSAYRKTPVFRDEIQYMEFNPTWTVPSSIFRKDKLERIRDDIGYLQRNNYTVRNRDGQTIAANSVNWGASNPGVTLVQQPGENNALGLVKFMFPNKYAVYLHDTNDRSLFDRNERNLSSGCVRLEYPFEFATLIMEGDPDWSYARMQSILDSGKTTRVDLPKPMPVLLTYWTAWVEDGEVHFREDPYERDERILQALDRE